MNKNTALGNKIQIVLENKFQTVEYFAQKFIIPGYTFGKTEMGATASKIILSGDTVDYDPLTVTILCDEYLNTWYELYADMMNKNPETGEIDPEAREYNITIIILSSKNNPIMKFKFVDSKVDNVGSLMYDVSNSDNIFFDATFAYDYYTIEKIWKF